MSKKKLNPRDARLAADVSDRLIKALGLTTPPKENKETLVRVRLTQKELDILKEIAEGEGQTLSAMIRERLPELNKI